MFFFLAINLGICYKLCDFIRRSNVYFAVQNSLKAFKPRYNSINHSEKCDFDITYWALKILLIRYILSQLAKFKWNIKMIKYSKDMLGKR